MHDILLILAAVLVTMATRFLPFLIFGQKRKTPLIIEYLGTVLPCAIMGMLVVYCLKGVTVTQLSSLAPADERQTTPAALIQLRLPTMMPSTPAA